MLVYRETVYICSSQSDDAEGQLFFYRQGIERTYPVATLSPTYSFQAFGQEYLIKVLIEPTQDKSFEVIVLYRSNLFTLYFNEYDVFNIQAYKLEATMHDIKFVKRCLMLFFFDG